ncbi:CYTH and CHAD domain-containing protein [soil metagenome]
MTDRPATRTITEREVKLSAWPGFEVPDLTGALAAVTVSEPTVRTLDAVYLDTPDLRLIRAGITVRHRSGDTADSVSEWTVKFPAGDDPGGAGALVRREVNIAGAAEPRPALVDALVGAHVRTARFAPVSHIQTLRRSLTLHPPGVADDADDTAPDQPLPPPWGEVDDDIVSVLDGDRVTARFREVEVEMAPGAPDGLLDAVVARLHDAGAGATDPVPKLVRALGPSALAPPEVPEPVAPADDAVAATVVQAALAGAVRRVMDHHHVICLDDDVEGVHQARVGIRRLRSDLRTFVPLLDDAWVGELRAELKWLADSLGQVRDADVLRARLLGDLEGLEPDDRKHGEGLINRLDEERAAAQDALVEVLVGDRYAVLLDDLVAAATRPRFAGRSDRPAADVVPGLVGAPWKKVRQAVGQLGEEPADEALHRVRVQVKRARYAADVAVPVAGKPARSAAKALSKVQDVLGDLQDAAVARDWLRRAGREAPAVEALVAGQLVAVEARRAAVSRAAFPAAWSAASDRKLWKWLS